MSVGDRAEEFISIHALGRERLVVSCVHPSHPLKFLSFARWETIEGFCPSFLHNGRHMCFYHRCLIGARHKSPAEE